MKSFVATALAMAMPKSGERELPGVYSDPNHPGCTRTISGLSGDSFQVFGFDAAAGEGFPCDGETDIAWGPLPGTIVDPVTQAIVVDFSSKGGPADLSGNFKPQGNPPFILWNDGNEWPKIVDGESSFVVLTHKLL